MALFKSVDEKSTVTTVALIQCAITQTRATVDAFKEGRRILEMLTEAVSRSHSLPEHITESNQRIARLREKAAQVLPVVSTATGDTLARKTFLETLLIGPSAFPYRDLEQVQQELSALDELQEATEALLQEVRAILAIQFIKEEVSA
jgi:transposase